MLWLCLAMLSLARRSQKSPREASVETVIVNCFSLSAAGGGFPLQTRQQDVARGGYAAARAWGESALRVSKEQRGERVQLCKKKKKFPDDQSENPKLFLFR
jgi:hypothetical protein